MRGEGFNPEIAQEAGREAATKEIGRRERSFLDSLKQGAERHRLALALLFSGALAEAMSGTARAQDAKEHAPSAEITDADKAEALEWNAMKELANELSARYEDLRAPYVFIDGYKEVYHQESSQSIRKVDGLESVGQQIDTPHKAFSGAASLQEKRLVVSAATGLFDDVRESESANADGGTSSYEVNSNQKVEIAIYAAAPEENDIANAESFRVKGWGDSEDQAIAHALREGSHFLATQMHSDRGTFTAGRAETRVQDGRVAEKSFSTQSRSVAYSSGISLAFIEGFTVTKMEKRTEMERNGSSRTYFVAHVEGLGNAVTMSQPDNAE